MSMSASSSEVSSEVRDRLLDAWRGEIVAGRVYELIAQRMPDRQAEVLRRMARAEGGHRARLEARMAERLSRPARRRRRATRR